MTILSILCQPDLNQTYDTEPESELFPVDTLKYSQDTQLERFLIFTD